MIRSEAKKRRAEALRQERRKSGGFLQQTIWDLQQIAQKDGSDDLEKSPHSLHDCFLQLLTPQSRTLRRLMGDGLCRFGKGEGEEAEKREKRTEMENSLVLRGSFGAVAAALRDCGC